MEVLRSRAREFEPCKQTQQHRALARSMAALTEAECWVRNTLKYRLMLFGAVSDRNPRYAEQLYGEIEGLEALGLELSHCRHLLLEQIQPDATSSLAATAHSRPPPSPGSGSCSKPS